MPSEPTPSNGNDSLPSSGPKIRGAVIAAIAIGVPFLAAVVLLILLVMSFHRLPTSPTPADNNTSSASQQ